MYPLQTIIKLLRLIVSGSKVESTPGTTDDNNEFAGINDVYSVLNTKLEDIKTKLDNLRVDVKADDIDIGEINVDTSDILTLLDERLIKKLLISRADYDALATKDANTLYYIN